MSGVFKYPSTLKPEAYQRLKKDLIAQSVGLHNAHVPLLLEGGMTYERISIPPEDAQFIATRKFQKTEIATIYGIPPHMIADLERATNNNIEHQGMEFVQYCLVPYLVRIEEEFNRKLLLEDEFGEYYFLFGLNGLLRGDAKTRSEYYKNMNIVGAMSANEIRSLEDMNSYDGGDLHIESREEGSVSRTIVGYAAKFESWSNPIMGWFGRRLHRARSTSATCRTSSCASTITPIRSSPARRAGRRDWRWTT